MTDMSPVNSDTSVSVRLREERLRLKKTQDELARACGVTKRTIIRWEKDVQIPADKLAKLVAAGFDAGYVLEGIRPGDKRQVTVDGDELDWLWSWRAMSAETRPKARRIIEALVADDVKKDKSPTIRKRPESDI